MYFEEPKHDPVSSAFLTEAQKNALVIVIIFKKKKNRKTKCKHVVRVCDNTETGSTKTVCRDIYIYVYAGVKKKMV